MKLKILSMGLRSGESLFGGVLACVIPEKLPATIRQRQDGSTEHRTTKLCGQSWRWCKNGQGGGRVWTSCILVGSSSRLFLVYCWLFDLTLCKTSNHGKDLTPVFPWCCLIFALFFISGLWVGHSHVGVLTVKQQLASGLVHHRPTYSPYRNPQMPGFVQVGDRYTPVI